MSRFRLQTASHTMATLRDQHLLVEPRKTVAGDGHSPRTWNVEQTIDWVKKIGLESVAPSFLQGKQAYQDCDLLVVNPSWLE
eukprot:m.783123 g.783123  ORF g.783123 m.783123 type:complete len:82 (+) comp59152_c1_seq49:604-849(+)